MRLRRRVLFICLSVLPVSLSLMVVLVTRGADNHTAPDTKRVPKVAAIVTAYFHNSHADVIVSRLLQTMTLDDKGERPALQLVSLYVDQPQGSSVGLDIARAHHIPIYKTPAEALTLGGKSLAVDGVLLIGEHGRYALSSTGQVIFPKRRLFTEILEVCDRSHRVVPVYTDKHLADNWEDAKWIYDQAHRCGMPLMAGSTLPLTWRYPPIDVKRNSHVSEIVATAYSSLEAYGYHGLEIIQCLAERRAGGETGVRSVQFYEGPRVWQAIAKGVISREVIEAATSKRRHSLSKPGEPLESAFKDPVLVVITYRDGLRAGLLWASNLVDFTAAWRDADTGKIESALFWTQEARPFMHFTYMVKGIEQMIQMGKPTWPVGRTLLVTGVLNAYFVSKKEGDRLIDTPWLDVAYQSTWDWHQPPPPPPGRPIPGQ
ncbi:MAG TPA: hypothetical protein VGP63_23770 [Planctomycetaceae bacterium]|jgi:hypothetical protein|nr:hypothetical protein [Planctomycetaceae bacterium]